MHDAPILSQVTLGYSPVIDRQRAVIATRLTIFPERPDAETDAVALLAAQTERSNAEDLDMVQAVSDFQNKQSGYDAALKSYSLVQKLSLFQYLSA